MFEIAVCDDCKMDRERLIKHIDNKDNQYELRIRLFPEGQSSSNAGAGILPGILS